MRSGLVIRQRKSKPIAELMHRWLLAHRLEIPDKSASARAMDYSIKRWDALVRYIDDAQLPIDNNLIENTIRPIAIGRSNWLFAGSLRAGQRAEAIMSLIQSALCRARHNADYAERQTMPSGPAFNMFRLSQRLIGSA